jgi:hypothetical protein
MTTKTLALDISGALQSTVDRSVAVGLKLLIFIVIVALGLLVARLLGRFTDRTLDRLRLNAAARRSGVTRWTGRYRPSELAARLVGAGVLLLALQGGFAVFGPNPVSELIAGIVRWLPRAFVGLVLVVVAASIGRALYEIVDGALGRLVYGPVLARATQVVVVALGVIAAVNQIGIATTVTEPVLIAVLGTVGGILVVGLGGGLIQPMRQRWERLLNRADADRARLRAAGTLVQPPYQARVATPGQDVQRAPTPTEPPRVRAPGSVL